MDINPFMPLRKVGWTLNCILQNSHLLDGVHEELLD